MRVLYESIKVSSYIYKQNELSRIQKDVLWGCLVSKLWWEYDILSMFIIICINNKKIWIKPEDMFKVTHTISYTTS